MKKGAELMLLRGMDVKVVELPEGKDPADIIQSDLSQFKKLVGRSVHVIEFLLHVLKRSQTDVRTLKLQAREEILPFILLLPNRIDQDHFVSIVAEEIGSTKEAIRFELDRLREENKLEPTTNQSDTLERTNTTDQINTDSARSAFLYLTALALVADKSVADLIQNQLDSYIPEHSFTITEAEAAELSFSLENQISKMPRRGLLEDVVSKLNYLRNKLLQQRLTQLRSLMQIAEQAEDTTASLEHLTNIQSVQEQLRAPRLSVEIFGETD
jgi:DNA primase